MSNSSVQGFALATKLPAATAKNVSVQRSVALVVLIALVGVDMAAALALGESQQPSSGAWEFLRSKYYGDKTMGLVDDTFLSLEAPANTPDPASTPLTLRLGDSAQRRIKRVRVFIDNNPSPLVATIDLDDATPVKEIDLRVRIDRFTSVRAVAETSDGGLEMRSSWVKASGGCSAPPRAAAAGKLGEIRLHPSTDTTSLQVNIRHPNNSGFQIDPVSGDAIPAHYISHINLSAGGHIVMSAETGISLSENPSFRIASDQKLPLPLSVDALDSTTQAHYTASWNGASSADKVALRTDADTSATH